MATGRAPVRRAVRTAHCKHMLIREGQTRSRSGDCGDSSGEVRYSLFSSRFRQRNATQRNSFPSHGREIQASLEGGERFTRLLEEHNTVLVLAPFMGMGMGKEEGCYFSLLFFGFSFLEGSCWLAENRMHAHFQLHKSCLDRVWRTESKRKKQSAVCFFLPKVCSKKIKKRWFFVRVSVMLCGGKPSSNSGGERSRVGRKC